MRVLGLSLAIAAFAISPAFAAPGDKWILGIHHINEFPGFTTFTGAGYSGLQSSGNASFVGNSYSHTGTAGDISRVYWELSGNSVNNGTPVPNTTQLYKVEYFGTTEAGHNSWQPVESQFHGAAGESFPHEPSIPWAGQFGTNHQWVGAGGSNDGQWHTMGPGPQTDTSNPADGTMLWLTAGSWLYAKWDFSGAPTDRSWSALRLTQVTPVTLPPVTGDYNKNGVVDAADYALWRKTYGSIGANLPADGFPDGFVDEYDYDVWREAFGNHNGSGTGGGLSLTGVPEPAAIALCAMAAAVFAVVPRRRSASVVCRRAPTQK